MIQLFGEVEPRVATLAIFYLNALRLVTHVEATAKTGIDA